MRYWAGLIALGAAAAIGAVVILQALEERAADARVSVRVQALADFDAGRHAAALPDLAAMSAMGRTEATRRLAVAYADGRGVTRDRSRALALYAEAAEAGDLPSRLALARLLLEGDDDADGPTEAAPHLDVAARAGSTEAMLALAHMYKDGRGFAQSYTHAAGWFRRAAEGGDPAAQRQIALFYRDGTGVPMDPVLAHAWLNVAAASFTAAQADLRAAAIAERAAIEAVLSEGDLRAARDRAHATFPAPG